MDRIPGCMNPKPNAWCPNQRSLFWFLANNGVFDVEVFKERGRYVLLTTAPNPRPGRLIATDVRSISAMTHQGWLDYIRRAIA